MKIWLDDLMDDRESNRVKPPGYYGAHSVNEAIELVKFAQARGEEIELIDLDHDLGDYKKDGGDAIEFLDYLVQQQIFPKVKFHTSNMTGRNNMVVLVNRHWPDELKFY